MSLVKSDVFEACAAIFQETGKPPTQRQILEKVKRGSYATIGPWRKEWCEKFLVEGVAADVLPQQVNKMIALLYQSMQSEVTQDIALLRANYEAQVEDLRKQLEQEQGAKQALEAKVGQLSVDYRELQVDIAQRDTQIDALRQDCEDHKQEEKDLKESAQRLQADLDKEQKALREARENEGKLNREVAQLSKSLGETEGRLSGVQGDLNVSERKLQETEQHLSRAKLQCQELTGEVTRLQTIADRVPELEASANRTVELQSEVGRLQTLEITHQNLVREMSETKASADRVPGLEKALRDQDRANGRLQANVEELQRQVAALQDQLAKAATAVTQPTPNKGPK